MLSSHHHLVQPTNQLSHGQPGTRLPLFIYLIHHSSGDEERNDKDMTRRRHRLVNSAT